MFLKSWTLRLISNIIQRLTNLTKGERLLDYTAVGAMAQTLCHRRTSNRSRRCQESSISENRQNPSIASLLGHLNRSSLTSASLQTRSTLVRRH